MSFEDGLRMLAKMIAREHLDFIDAERLALERSETVNMEPWPVERELSEPTAQVIVITGEDCDPLNTGMERRES